jgi:DNA-directed RNA polymerase subunit RPC12/RpoP
MPLQSLADHNLGKLAVHTYPRPNGIACPKCQSEMNDVNGMALMSNPPKKAVECPKCGHKDIALQ